MSENRYSHTSSNRLVRRTVALVLAGGKGTRLKEITSKVAKPAVSFGGKYRIIDFTLSNCINSGVRNIGVLTQYMAHDLIMHLQSGWQIQNPALDERVSIIPAQQRTGENWYRGTADAVYQNLDIIDHDRYDRVLILGGDHIYKMDYSRMINFHAENNADVTVACIRKPLSQASAFGVMGLDEEGRITDFEEKPKKPKSDPNHPEQALVSMGIYIFNMDVLDQELREGLIKPGYSHDFGHNVIPNILKNRNVYGYIFAEKGHPGENAYWRDVGDIDEYFAANMDLVAPKPELDLYDREWPIITDQKQRPGAKFIFNEVQRCGYATDSLLSAGVIVSGAKVHRSLLSLDVRVEEHSELEEVIALNGACIGKNCKIRRAILTEDCVIPDNSVIGYDEAEDRRRFTISAGGVLVIASYMLV